MRLEFLAPLQVTLSFGNLRALKLQLAFHLICLPEYDELNCSYLNFNYNKFIMTNIKNGFELNRKILYIVFCESNV